jgi:hypothetical protein
LLGTAALESGAANPTWSNSLATAVSGTFRSVAEGDFNGDRIKDLAFIVTSSPEVAVYLGNGDGTFSPAVLTPGIPANSTSGIAVGDFNGDGKQDLAILSSNALTVLLGKGDGTFKIGDSLPVGAVPSQVLAGDFNEDGVPDLAVLNTLVGGQQTCYETPNATGTVTVPQAGHIDHCGTYPICIIDAPGSAPHAGDGVTEKAKIKLVPVGGILQGKEAIMGLKHPARAKTGCGKHGSSSEIEEKRSAGAKAHPYFQPFAARLKSCPVTKPRCVVRLRDIREQG